MKKISVILCLIVMGLAGCTNNGIYSEAETESGHNVSEDYSEDEPVQKLTLTDAYVRSEYTDGYLWMDLLSEEYSSMDGIVNKEGEVIAAIPGTGYEGKVYKGHSEFEDGYAFIFFDTEVHVLDTNGDIISTQKIGEDNQLASYGAGYIVIENHIHDFDYNSYEYVFYNPEGEEITKYVPDDGESQEITYMGGGVFSFNTVTEDGNKTNDIYFSKTNKWLQKRIGYARNDIPVTFGKSDKRVIDCYQEDEGGVLIVIDKNGDVAEYRLSIKPEHAETIIAYSLISDNYCLVIDGDSIFKGESISVLDLNTGDQTKMSDTYFDKIKNAKMDWYSEYEIYFDNDVFSIPLLGDDGEFYIGLFDVNCNLVSDPVRIDSYEDYSFSDGRLVVRQRDADVVEVYSADGQELYTVNDKHGGYNLNQDIKQEYSDGVFIDITSDLGDIRVYDLDGNNLYTSLNTANTKILLYE